MVDVVEGGYYAVEGEDASGRPVHGVFKVLKVDEGGVHVRQFRETFPTAPVTIDPNQLTIGIGHLPFPQAQFDAYEPVLVEPGSVSAEELEGYTIWLEAEGGYFGLD